MGKELEAESRARRARELLAAVAGKRLSPGELEASSLELAGELFDIAESRVGPDERARRRRLSRLLGDPKGQLLSVLLTDRVARDKTFEHSAEQVSYLVARLGVPKFMTAAERLQLTLGGAIGNLAPHLTGKLIARHIREEVKGLVFPIEPQQLAAYLERRHAEGISVNVNQLGEEVLGEAQAQRRLAQYIALLERPEVETISVKLSSIFSQIDLFAWESSLGFLADRLRLIYRAARRSSSPKLVYLDMEAYKDLRFTLELFRRLLSEPELSGLTAGVVLQAYIPDSFALQRELTDFAIERRRRGGAPIRLRIVKGANLAAERVHASRMGWEVPIYATKHEVDANYKRMLLAATEPRAAAAVNLGIASHNLFDLALGLVLRASRGVEREVGFEVLEGMANSVQRALTLVDAPVLTYAPAVGDAELDTAVAYLIRRLDENTASDNFLRHYFSMRRGDDAFEAQAARFQKALSAVDTVGQAPLRTQNRFGEIVDLAKAAPFANEPDTDFSVVAHRDAVLGALAALGRRACFELCSHIGGTRQETGVMAHGFDPSRPRVVPYRYHLARPADLERAVKVARRALDASARREERREVVRKVAKLLRRRRAELIAAMVLDAGKRVSEADAEVSEAIDFAEYYLRQAEARDQDESIVARAKGVVLVTSPWNFPLAIPMSGVLAAYLGDNSVIFKPALETAFVGERLAAVLWEAGVPMDVLSFILCRDEDGSMLLRHPDVAAVVLTGATSTARFFLEQRPSLDLHAETGGKNAFIVSELADRELAIRDLVTSAFGHAGQKCSAASLSVLVGPVHDDLYFREELRDAVESLAVGSAWDPASMVTPLIRPPGPDLLRALTTLDPGESWLLQPRQHPDNPCLWSPGIKLVAPGSFSHQTELFGPVLSVLAADDLDHAIDLANATPYGLTAGLHSLDEREQARFVERIEAGNLYINRTIVGAIVGRQPFGGHKASSVGPGAKAGGPNYLIELQDLVDAAPGSQASGGELTSIPVAVRAVLEWASERLPAADVARLRGRILDYHGWIDRYFSRPQPSVPAVLGQDNTLVYRPVGPLLLVANETSAALDVASALAAALLAGSEVHLSIDPAGAGQLAALEWVVLGQSARASVSVEPASEIAVRLERGAKYLRLRWLAARDPSPPDALARAAAANGCYVSTRPVLGAGRYELLFYHREQAISSDYHRYGHLGFRSEGLGEVADAPALNPRV